MQLSFSGLDKLEGGQRGIEGFFSAQAANAAPPNSAATKPKTDPRAASEEAKPARDVPRPKKGVASFFPPAAKTAPAAKPDKKRKADRTVSRDSPALVTVGSTANGTEEVVLASSSDDEEPEIQAPRERTRRQLDLPTFRCPKCSEVIKVPADTRHAAERDGKVDEDKARQALDRAKAEHADWHLARDLLGELRFPSFAF